MSECNVDCNCQGIPYTPVCSNEDGYSNFFSPCHAGCDTIGDDTNDTITYTNCRCLQSQDVPPPSIFTEGDFTFENGTVTNGVCPVDCQSKFYGLLGFLTIFAIVGSTTRIPNFILSLRAVELKDKTASLTLSVSFLSLFAFLPSPMVYGALLDSTCLLWDSNKCGETTHCLIYDTDAMRNYLAFFPAGFFILSLLADVGIWYYSKHMSIYDDNTDEAASNEDQELKDQGFKEVDLDN